MNTKKHLFFLDAKKNSSVPSWFVDCSRDDAATVLIKRSRDGNVLMRPASDGQYAITVKTTSSRRGTIKINHYSIRRNERNEFYVDIDIRHQPAPTLSEIFERFLRLSGNRKYRAFGSEPKDSAGCLPEVEPSERSKLSAPAVMIRNVPQQQQQQYSTYDDMRSASRGVNSTTDDGYLPPTSTNAGGAPDGDGEYLTTLPSDDEEPDKCVEYLTVTQDNDGYLPMNKAATPDSDYLNLNQEVSKMSIRPKPTPPDSTKL